MNPDSRPRHPCSTFGFCSNLCDHLQKPSTFYACGVAMGSVTADPAQQLLPKLSLHREPVLSASPLSLLTPDLFLLVQQGRAGTGRIFSFLLLATSNATDGNRWENLQC